MVWEAQRGRSAEQCALLSWLFYQVTVPGRVARGAVVLEALML